MAKSTKKAKSTSRQGKVPVGWGKQNVQIPDQLAKEFKQRAGEQGHGAIKIMSTSAIAFLLSLSQDEIDIVCNYVRQMTWSDPSNLKKSHVRELIRMILNGESVVDESRMIQQRLEEIAKKTHK